jgi:hypothetical protein
VAFLGDCGPHFSAGAFLLRWHRGRWEVVRMLEIANPCRPIRVSNGRDLLVCRDGPTNGFSVAIGVFILDASRAKPYRPLAGLFTLLTLGLAVCEKYAAAAGR